MTKWAAPVVGVIALIPGCGVADRYSAPEAGEPVPTTEVFFDLTDTAGPTGPAVRNWFDLQPGECIVDLPRVELGEAAVTVVNCTTPHSAEVYLRVPIAVDTAIPDTANEQCAAGLPAYTGQAVESSTYTMTYFVDANQDRTFRNPRPSTAICLLQAEDGSSLTASARR
ncbi:hypothetical protein [Mycolicibacterium mengxianglii]|uniref:hypothetical protein n=1 Tax=Mycolicibacterium mengxianglii TaxID=2736649 RepID=UPI0018D00A31|nr:hypothetical protein [Mycolicibacterium mengxianglii]